jgi:hypothetical protein
LQLLSSYPSLHTIHVLQLIFTANISETVKILIIIDSNTGSSDIIEHKLKLSQLSGETVPFKCGTEGVGRLKKLKYSFLKSSYLGIEG